jgi:hypothetical protein
LAWKSTEKRWVGRFASFFLCFCLSGYFETPKALNHWRAYDREGDRKFHPSAAQLQGFFAACFAASCLMTAR